MLSISLQETPDAEQGAAEQPLPALEISELLMASMFLLFQR
jgi:hypothetical protein